MVIHNHDHSEFNYRNLFFFKLYTSDILCRSAFVGCYRRCLQTSSHECAALLIGTLLIPRCWPKWMWRSRLGSRVKRQSYRITLMDLVPLDCRWPFAILCFFYRAPSVNEKREKHAWRSKCFKCLSFPWLGNEKLLIHALLNIYTYIDHVALCGFGSRFVNGGFQFSDRQPQLCDDFVSWLHFAPQMFVFTVGHWWWLYRRAGGGVIPWMTLPDGSCWLLTMAHEKSSWKFFRFAMLACALTYLGVLLLRQVQLLRATLGFIWTLSESLSRSLISSEENSASPRSSPWPESLHSSSSLSLVIHR